MSSIFIKRPFLFIINQIIKPRLYSIRLSPNATKNHEHSSIIVHLVIIYCPNQMVFLVLYSEFADIYDENHFISSLRDFVTVVHDLPIELMESYNFSISNIPSFKVPAWASVRYYMDEVYPLYQETRYIIFSSNMTFKVWSILYQDILIIKQTKF